MKRLMTNLARKTVRFVCRGNAEHLLRACKVAKYELEVARSLPEWTKRFSQLQGQKDLQLNIGCGPNSKPGWINVDLSPDAEYRYDLRRGLPLGSESCRIVYSEHFFEHLSYGDACRFLHESYRVLQPGGLFRVVLPDFPAIFRAYVYQDTDYFEPIRDWPLVPGVKPADMTLIDYLNYSVYQFGEHLCLWDEEKLRQCLRQAGFVKMEESQFQPDLDSSVLYRLHFSFYFQARK
jgi:predicted SAM-dependent methyltransferase